MLEEIIFCTFFPKNPSFTIRVKKKSLNANPSSPILVSAFGRPSLRGAVRRATRRLCRGDFQGIGHLGLTFRGMQKSRPPPPEEAFNSKPRKKKPVAHDTTVFHSQGDVKERPDTLYPPFKTQKVLKGNSTNEASPSFQQPERSNSDSLPDSSKSGGEYRALRRKYLMSEEESFLLKNELSEVEAEVKTLEEEKFALLDQLLVLEGLVDPSVIQTRGGL